MALPPLKPAPVEAAKIDSPAPAAAPVLLAVPAASSVVAHGRIPSIDGWGPEIAGALWGVGAVLTVVGPIDYFGSDFDTSLRRTT